MGGGVPKEALTDSSFHGCDNRGVLDSYRAALHPGKPPG